MYKTVIYENTKVTFIFIVNLNIINYVRIAHSSTIHNYYAEAYKCKLFLNYKCLQLRGVWQI